jgi:hypothetical protein
VRRIAVFEEDGLQPVSRVCRAAVRRAAAVLADSGIEIADERPPRAADLRAAFTRSSTTSSRQPSAR